MKYQFELPTGNLTINTTKETIPFNDSIKAGARNNPKRGFLIVSTLIGRHLPTSPEQMALTMDLLAGQIGPISTPVTFIGMAETAVGLGEGISASWQRQNGATAKTLQTTRQRIIDDEGVELALTSSEDHSHAAEHLLYAPKGQDWFSGHTIIIVDDECTTGNTYRNLEAQIRQRYPEVAGFHYVAIANWSQTPVISLIEGELQWEGKELDYEPLSPYHGLGQIPANDGPRCGLIGTRTVNANLHPAVPDENILVLSDGENGYEAFLVAQQLASQGAKPVIQSITRSPVLIAGAIGGVHHFEDAMQSGAPMFCYNIGEAYDRIVIVSNRPNRHDESLRSVRCALIEKVIL